ncbi:MAG TPA: S8 family serine peptidase, partial [Elusimicrobiota bacterium]|nr:S8 family serine peptidase [Elusimicrobiota bacterium]
MRYIRRGRRALAVAALLLLGSNARAEPGKLDPRLIRLKRGPSAYPAGRRAAGLTYVGGQATVDVHIRLRPGADPDGIRRRFPQAVFRSLNGRYWTAEFPLSALEALDADPDLEHASAEQKARLYLDVVRSSTTSSGLFLGVLDGDSTGFLSNQGAGVVVGVVDTGIDFRHLDFVNTGSPNTSRILSLWDQTDSGGPSPGGSFAYGTQWTQAQLNAEVGSSPPHVVRETDTEGHGTHVAGIAAGNGNASTPVGTFTGLAPQADIVFVKTDLGTSHIVDGVNYIIQKAAAAGKRAVINLSLGTDLGPHDGTSSFTASIDAIAASTPVALAAGNSQGSGVHASAQLVGPIGSTTFGTSVAAGLTGALLDFWASAGTGYTVTASASGFSGSVQATNGQQVSGVIGNSLVTIYNHRSSNSNGDPEIEIEIDAPNNGTINLTNLSVAFNETSGSNGKIDGWSDPAPDIQFSAPSSASSVSDLATGSNAIAVGCYCDKNFWLSTQGFFQDNDCLGSLGSLGAISPFSGRGPTRATGSDLGRTKPDIAAPGEMVASSLSTNATPQTGETAPDGKHQFLAGTSMASPVVAGLAALVVQRRPDFTAAQVKSHILTHSRSDSDVTAQGTPLPNNAFGAGKAKACLLPAQPTSFTVSTLGTSSIQWTWAASEKATTYSLAYATNTASVIAVIPANPPSFTFSNLDADTLYGLQVTAVNACGTSQPAISPSTATLANAPSSVSAVFHASSATVTFTALPVSPQSASSFGYRLEASTASNFSGTVFSSATTNPAVSRLQLPGLTVNTQYYLRLSSLNPLG